MADKPGWTFIANKSTGTITLRVPQLRSDARPVGVQSFGVPASAGSVWDQCARKIFNGHDSMPKTEMCSPGD